MKKDTLKYSDHIKCMVKVAGASKSLKQEMLGTLATKKRTSITLDTSKGPM